MKDKEQLKRLIEELVKVNNELLKFREDELTWREQNPDKEAPLFIQGVLYGVYKGQSLIEELLNRLDKEEEEINNSSKQMIIIEMDKNYQGNNPRACKGCHYRDFTPPWKKEEEGSICDRQKLLDVKKCRDAMIQTLGVDYSGLDFENLIWKQKA